MNYFKLSERLYNDALGSGISEDDMRTVAAWPLNRVTLLFAAADQARRHFYNDGVDPCTLMNIKSGGCGEDCAFCTQSSHNKADVKVQGLAGPDEIVRNCNEAWARGLPFCVVSSGRKLGDGEFRAVIKALIDCGDGGEKHASLGILGDDEFKALRDAGVACYNHNVETSRSFFGSIVTTHTYDDRINTVKRAKSAGLKVCCGGIFGMGESWEQRIEMCVELRGLGVDTVPINFLNAVPGTRVRPLNESPLELLKIVSLFRLSIPKATIKVCGGREKNLGQLQSLIFHAGANGYITGGYLTTPGAGIDEDDRMIRSLGLDR
ncbi:MAG: biotin synthase BioB [Chitinispirillia bacterium]|nr:biotin synthase BioB [Chitinispirillia bacterium]MCL2268932.1 biotin synthase BioB [Chitinispirillia bacterium]